MKKLVSLLLAAVMLTSLLPLTFAAAEEPVTLDLFVDFTWFPHDTWEGIIPAELTKNGGVAFEVTRAADGGQLGLMIASGELPDLVWTSDSLSKLCDPELVYSYDELIEKYNVDWQPDDERIGIAKTHNIDPDDTHYYTIVQNYNTQAEWAEARGVAPGLSGLYYRKDIWEALGSPDMSTLEGIMNVLGMVKEQYPDMIPLNAGNNYWRLSPFRDWISGAEFQYVDEEGNVKLRDTTEKFYDFLKYVNTMYRNGYFPIENLALTVEDDARQQMITGQCFMYEWNARPTPQMENLNLDLRKEIPDGRIALCPMPDDAVEMQRANAGWAGLFISRNCKDPEAAIKMVAYLNSAEGRHLALWGREGIDWIADEYGAPQFTEEYVTARAQDDFSAKYANEWYMCTTELDEAYTYFSGLDAENLADFTKNLDKVVSHPELAVARPASGTDEAVILSKINDARNAEMVKIYTAETDEAFEAAYQSWMGILKQIGVEQLEAYMTKQAAELKAQFGF